MKVITMDEQLFLIQLRCRFLQYMPNKTFKFGINFWLAVVIKTNYILKKVPYLEIEELRTNHQCF